MLRTSHQGEPEASRAADVSLPVSPVITLAGVSKRFQNTVALHKGLSKIRLSQITWYAPDNRLLEVPYGTHRFS